MELTDQPVPRRWIDVHAARFRAPNWALVHVLHSSSVIDKGGMSVRWRRPRVPDAPVRRALNLLVACVLPVLFPQGFKRNRPTVRLVGCFIRASPPELRRSIPPPAHFTGASASRTAAGNAKPQRSTRVCPAVVRWRLGPEVGQVHLVERRAGLAASEQVKRRDAGTHGRPAPRTATRVRNLRRAGCGARRRCARPGAQEMPWPLR